ncbi:MAG: AmmeMemoRadiSam system protein A [Eubacteriales bacterium]|nr:AmmeMemoRadiSam system protein A [Eubacteriales bacterium]
MTERTPSNTKVANHLIAAYLAPHPPIIIPQIGQAAHEAKLTIAALETAAEDLAFLMPETLVVISPHAPQFSDFVYFYAGETLTGNFQSFGHSEVALSRHADLELAQMIIEGLHKDQIEGGFLTPAQEARHELAGNLDHGVLVPLYYLGQKIPTARLVALSCSGLPLKDIVRVGQIISHAANHLGRRIVLICSGDLSHKVNPESPYGSCPEGSQFDQEILRILSSGELSKLLTIDPELRDHAAECGYRPLVALAGAFADQTVQTKIYHYEAPYGIGYGVAQILPTPSPDKPPPAVSIPVQLAKDAIEFLIRTGQRPTYLNMLNMHQGADFTRALAPFLQQQAGVFVSLHLLGELRGCIGTTEPTTEHVVLEIIQNAMWAATKDPRFKPVSADELAALEISVDILGPAETIDSPSDLDPHRYGVIVSHGSRRGLLLPDLEGVDSAEAQIQIACRKAGIDSHEPILMQRFEVIRYY